LIFGGLYDLWQNNLKTFSIITTTPNAEMAQVHTRMPVILNEAADVATWLSANSPVDRLMKICRTPPDGLLGMYRVSEKINSAKFRTTETLKPAPEDLTLF
jgi:putative SOS response-associated peptidase YedK